MLVIVILLFAICWGPILIDNVLTSFGYLDVYNYGVLKYTRQIMSLMSYANSCFNPIIYCFMSKNFRKSFQYALSPCLPRKYRTQNATNFSRSEMTSMCTGANAVAGSTRRSMYDASMKRGSLLYKPVPTSPSKVIEL